MIIGLILVLLISFFYLLILDKKMKSSLYPYMDAEVERLTRRIVTKAIRKKIATQNYGNFIENTNGTITYDIQRINQLKEEITNHLDQVITNLEEASIKDPDYSEFLKTGKFKKIKNGILAENSINSLKGTTIFGNLGPTIPIRLYFTGQVQSEIDIQAKEYGINNIIMEVYLIVTVKEQIIMPLTSKRKEVTIKEVLEVDILKGEIPNYYTDFSK